jgi:hypothetical protein
MWYYDVKVVILSTTNSKNNMKNYLFTIVLTITTGSFAQASFTEAQAKGMVETFFEGFHKGDATIMQSVMATDVTMQTASTNKEGKHIVSTGNGQDLLNAISNIPADQIWEEKILGYNVQIDGNLAHVWTPYEFWLNGAFSHCGVNSFQLIKMEETWKIIYLIDTRRREGCNQ